MATLFTIGHSTRSAQEFVALLRENGVRTLVDVRRFPGSRRYPQFGRDALADTLAGAGIEYQHAPELGGRREPRPESRNTAWRNASFRAYADHMETAEFETALGELIARAQTSVSAVMCAEAVPWRCHRNLIADALVARGHTAVHILAPGDRRSHELNQHARVGTNGTVAYPAPAVDDQTGLF